MPLYQCDKEQYGDNYQNHLLEQWSKCVDMANCISDRRIGTSNIYITINAAIFAVVSFGGGLQNGLLSISGIIICILWHFSIVSYKELNRVKYSIINDIECKLPISPYKHEWDMLKESGKYRNFTCVEQILPWVFIVIYGIILAVPFVNWIIELIND